MQYRGHDFKYDAESGESDADGTQEQPPRQQYSRKRSIRATRRRNSKKPANQPGCGIGARRNNRWAW